MMLVMVTVISGKSRLFMQPDIPHLVTGLLLLWQPSLTNPLPCNVTTAMYSAFLKFNMHKNRLW